MSKIGIVVDSTCYLDNSFLSENNIKVASLGIIVEGQEFLEIDMKSQDVLEYMDNGKKVTSSQPAPALYVNAYKELFDEGCDKILCFTLSSGLSGSFNSANLAANITKRVSDIHIFDPKLAAYGVEMLVIEAVEAVKENKSFEDLIEYFDILIKNGNLTFTIKNLKYLYKGGRLSRTQAVLGSLLHIKPVIRMIDGKLELVDKARTYTKIMQSFKDILDDIAKKANKFYVRIIALDEDDRAIELKEYLLSKYNKVKVTITHYLGPVFTVHLGRSGLGIAWTYE